MSKASDWIQNSKFASGNTGSEKMALARDDLKGVGLRLVRRAMFDHTLMYIVCKLYNKPLVQVAAQNLVGKLMKFVSHNVTSSILN